MWNAKTDVVRLECGHICRIRIELISFLTLTLTPSCRGKVSRWARIAEDLIARGEECSGFFLNISVESDLILKIVYSGNEKYQSQL